MPCIRTIAARDEQALSVALKWHEACVALGGKTDPLALPNFDHTGLKLATMQPVEKGWIEPEAAAGIAWLEYMAWVRFKDPRFLTAADWAIRSLEEQAGRTKSALRSAAALWRTRRRTHERRTGPRLRRRQVRERVL